MKLKWETYGDLQLAKSTAGFTYMVWQNGKALSGAKISTTYHETVAHAKARAEALERDLFAARERQGDG